MRVPDYEICSELGPFGFWPTRTWQGKDCRWWLYLAWPAGSGDAGACSDGGTCNDSH